MFAVNPRPVSGPITREGLRTMLERKASQLLPVGDPYGDAAVNERIIYRPLFAASFEGRRQPQNKFEVVIDFSPGFSRFNLVRVQRTYFSGLKVDCDRFTIELRCARRDDDGDVLQLTHGAANLLGRCVLWAGGSLQKRAR
jgi:hypothetical protein